MGSDVGAAACSHFFGSSEVKPRLRSPARWVRLFWLHRAYSTSLQHGRENDSCTVSKVHLPMIFACRSRGMFALFFWLQRGRASFAKSSAVGPPLLAPQSLLDVGIAWATGYRIARSLIEH